MNLKPWREIAEPHADVREGTFQQAEFAAGPSRVHTGTANAEYQNPARFFQRTFITEGMRLLLDSVVKRLVGQGGDPVSSAVRPARPTRACAAWNGSA
jgi:predicted AAA+ superfamily ATPase